MSITTDSTIDIGTYTTFNIGLSKYIGQYTEQEIFDFAYCSSDWRFYRHIGDVTYNDYAPGATGENMNKNFPLKWVARNQNTGALDFDPGEIEYNQPDTGIYARIIWLYSGQSPISTVFPNNKRSITNGDNVKIITSMDMTRCRVHAKDVVLGDYVHQIGVADQTNYIDFDNFKIIENHENVTTYEPPSHGVVFPAIMFLWHGKLHIHRLFQNNYFALDWSWYISTDENTKSVQGYEWDAQSLSFDGTQGVYFPINIYRQFTNLYPLNIENHESWTVDFQGDVGAIYQWRFGSHTGGRINPATEDTYLEAISWYGCMFEHKGIQYKPIIKDGYITGYTDDMTADSEFDNYIGATNHSVPSVSPAGGGGSHTGDNEKDMPLSQHATTSGFVHYYSMTYANIIKTADALNRFDITLLGKDLLRNIISYKLFAIPPTRLIKSSTNVIVHIAGHELKDEQDNYITGDVIESLKTIDLGAITIFEHFGDFRDYAPYTKLEIYVPFCGWATLPPWCMGKTLTGEMFIDLPNGTVKAVIKSSKTVVAELGGCCSVDIPFAAESTGAKTAAVISKIANTAAAVASGSIPAIGTSSISLIGAINANYTDMQGVCGDGSNLNGLDYVYVKVSRPSDEFKTIPSQYKHQYGLPCNKEITLAEGDGYTQVNDADVTGTMTAKEKQMIIDGFRHGLIL